MTIRSLLRVHRLPAGYLLVAPALLIISVFFLLPVMASLLLSLTDFDIYGLADVRNVRPVGLGNYGRLTATQLFWTSLGNTCYFVLVAGPLSIGLSLAAALMVTAQLTRCKGVFRTLFFTPVVTTLVAVAIVWRYMFHGEYGMINAGLRSLGMAPIDWLGDPHWSMPAIVILAAWKNFGYNMVIFVAGLQNIPAQLYEAAVVDGAGSWTKLVKITLPLLGPTFLFVVVTTTIGYFQLFAEPYVMTRGGPLHSTYSVVMYMYEEGFRWWNLGFASAVAFVLFLIVLLVTAAQLAFRTRESP